MVRCAQVNRLPMQGPDDTTGIEQLFESGTANPNRVIAILGKTEGNGCVNDFTRGYATQSVRKLLGNYLTDEKIEHVPLVMSGGTEGGITPHWLVFSWTEGVSDSPATEQSMAIASSITRDLEPQEIGRRTQALLVRDAVVDAMAKAEISSPDDVHLVQIKCPLLTSERINSVNGDVATPDTLKSMGLSRGASALGVALALGEVDAISDGQIGEDLDVWSGRASCSAGIELMSCEVVVLGQSVSWAGPLSIRHGVMQDAIDSVSVAKMLSNSINWTLGDEQCRHRVVATIAKAEASNDGLIQGSRHTMLQDSDISSTRHARAFVGGLMAGLLGTTELFVSGGAEHQGPDGGGPFAIIYSR